MNEMNQFFMFEEILTAYLKENPSSFFHQKKTAIKRPRDWWVREVIHGFVFTR